MLYLQNSRNALYGWSEYGHFSLILIIMFACGIFRTDIYHRISLVENVFVFINKLKCVIKLARKFISFPMHDGVNCEKVNYPNIHNFCK